MTRFVATLSLTLVVAAVVAVPAQAQFIVYPNGSGGVNVVNSERIFNPASNVPMPGTFRYWYNPVTGRMEYSYIDITGQPRGSITSVNPFTGGVDRVVYSKAGGTGSTSGQVPPRTSSNFGRPTAPPNSRPGTTMPYRTPSYRPLGR